MAIDSCTSATTNFEKAKTLKDKVCASAKTKTQTGKVICDIAQINLTTAEGLRDLTCGLENLGHALREQDSKK
jgi:hypothetical protein